MWIFFDIFPDDGLLDRLAKISANPFTDWSYSTSSPPPLAPMVSIPKEPSADAHSKQNDKFANQTTKRRKRGWQTRSPEPESKRRTPDFSAFDKENKIGEKVQLQEFYYATMDGNKAHSPKEHKNAFLFKVRNLYIQLFFLSFLNIFSSSKFQLIPKKLN